MNCKPGILAYVASLDDPAFAANINHIVTVVSLADYPADGPRWNIVANAPGLIAWDPWNQKFVRTLEGTFRDANLRPISGVPVNEEVTDEVTA